MTPPSTKFFEKKIDGFKFLSKEGKKRAKKRIEDVIHLVPTMSKYDYVLRDHNDLPRMEYMGAIEKYLVGFYPESLYNSINSVELGLVIKLNAELSAIDKEEIYRKINSDSKKDRISFTFGFMKNLAIQHRIIKGKRSIAVFDRITDFRNTIFHPANLMHLLISNQQVMIPEFDNYIEQFEKIEKSYVAKILPYLKNINNLAKYGKNALEKTDSLDWTTKDNSNKIARSQISTLINEKMTEGKKLKEEIELNPLNMLKVPDYINKFQDEGIMKHLALNTINGSFEALEILDIFSN